MSPKSAKQFVRYQNFSIFKRPPSTILDFEKFLNFWSTVRFGGLMCIAVPNFTKIGQTVAEISCLSIFNMVAVLHLGFLKVLFFEQLVSSGGTNMCQHAKFHQNRPNGFCDIAIFWFSRWPPSAILYFEIFGFPSGGKVYKMHHPTKFHQNRSTAADIVYCV